MQHSADELGDRAGGGNGVAVERYHKSRSAESLPVTGADGEAALLSA